MCHSVYFLILICLVIDYPPILCSEFTSPADIEDCLEIKFALTSEFVLDSGIFVAIQYSVHNHDIMHAVTETTAAGHVT